MIRKSVLDENNLQYPENCLHAEDYKLWSDMSRFCKLAVYPEVLTFLRAHDDGISCSNEYWQAKIVNLILLDNIIKNFAPNKNYMYSIFVKYIKAEPVSKEEFNSVKELLIQVHDYLFEQISSPYNSIIKNYIFSILKGFVIAPV